MQLSQRKQMILAAIVELYIENGEPVSSKSLMDKLDMSVSSATIRNEMSELSANQYLTQPHTSAGRIPTQKGFRYYIDHLMRQRELTEEERRKIQSLLPVQIDSPDELLEDASSALAQLTGCAALFTTPADDEAQIKRIDLIPVGKRTCMILLQTTTGVIKTRICRIDGELSLELVEMFQRVVAAHFENLPLSNVTLVLVQTITASLGENALLLSPLLVGICDVVRDAVESQLKMDGESNLWTHREYEGSIQQLVNFLSHRELLHHIVSNQKNGLNILIGNENQYEELKSSSMILSKYSIGGKDVGSLGIIGPIRIDYAQLIPSVEYLTVLVGNLLSELFELDY